MPSAAPGRRFSSSRSGFGAVGAARRAGDAGEALDEAERRPGQPALRARAPERKPMAPEALHARLVDAAAQAEVAQLRPESRAHALPASDADVRVVSLREDPAVAAGDRSELDRGESLVLLPADVGVGHVPLERDPVGVAAAKA